MTMKPPFPLSKVARAEWRRLIQVAYWLDEPDAGLLAERCEVFAQLREAQGDVTKRGLLVEGHRGHTILNPAARVARALRDQLIRYDVQLGLSSKGRGGGGAEPKTQGYWEGSMDDPLERALCTHPDRALPAIDPKHHAPPPAGRVPRWVNTRGR
jgi:P27 family predicted phage terminase small subunit